ncbi:hypothetical protein ADUPG1_012433 [Aduncisulcus paluster]|uniref:Uncharacterized protein n=1 Tax=Aduncisulcus paluster TaxID=2918883 RepID=A0ABQ5K1L3_9EUKA|nr:hypothetical protein ADUPG1_012433 [Aduncisulcus paluster]
MQYEEALSEPGMYLHKNTSVHKNTHLEGGCDYGEREAEEELWFYQLGAIDGEIAADVHKNTHLEGGCDYGEREAEEELWFYQLGAIDGEIAAE